MAGKPGRTRCRPDRRPLLDRSRNAHQANVVLPIGTAEITPAALVDLLESPYNDDVLAAGLHAVVVRTDSSADALTTRRDAGSLPLVVIGVRAAREDTRSDHLTIPTFDVVVEDGDPRLDTVLATITRHPVASASLTVLLRASAQLPVEHALAAESAVYSALQSGAEFAAWRAENTRSPAPPDTHPAVVADREGDTLRIVLDRPHRHNAFSRSMRDALCEMLALAVADRSIDRVELSGNGPSFCSGGDLGEFGSFGDPASAHTTRLTRSPARLLHRLADRTHVQLHGACIGAGIELAAFAKSVTAHPDATIALPEVDLGLIPGAGGTVSITRRIGRQRCALLALGGPITAGTASAWGLVDAVSPTRATAWHP